MQLNRYSVEPQSDESEAQPQPASSRSSGNFSRWIIATIALGLFALGGLFFAPQIIRIATDQGEIVIETNDPDVEVEILRDGKVFRVVDTKTDQSFDIRSGSYEIRAKANPSNLEADQNVAFDVTPNRLIMKRGQKQIVTVTKTAKAPGSSASVDGVGSPGNDPKVQAKELVSDKPFLRTYPITVDPKLAFDLLGTMLEGSNARMQQDKGSGAITVLGRTQDHRVVAESLAGVGNVESGYLVLKTEIEAQISEAQAAVDKALGDMEKTRELVKRGLSKSEKLDEAQQVVKSAELRLKNANQKLISLESLKPSTPIEGVKDFRTFSLRHISARDVTTGLRSFLGQETFADGDTRIPATEVEVIPDYRSNQVTVKGSQSILLKAADFLMTIDVASVNNQRAPVYEELVSDKPFLRTYPITVDPKLAFDLLRTMLEGSNARVQQDEQSGNIVVLGRKEDHEVVAKSLDSIQNAGDNRRVKNRHALVYDGQDFGQWLNIAETDRSPKVVANAIRACGALAETDAQRKELFQVVEGTAKRHGNIVIDGTDEEVMSAMLDATWNQPPEMAVDFVEEQLKNGNSRSRQFCNWILIGGFNNSTAPDIKKISQAFASRLSDLLPLTMKQNQLADNLVGAASSIPREQLLKLNPKLDSLVGRLFWEQTKVKDSEVVAPLGSLAAYLRNDDVKIAEYLADQILKRAEQSNGVYDRFFQAFTSDRNGNGWNWATNCNPIVGWHDEFRFKKLLGILNTELKSPSGQQNESGKPEVSEASQSQFLMVYQIQECLNALMPTMDSEMRQNAKEKITEIKRNLRKKFKSFGGGQTSDVEHNLDALIAACDGNSEPALIKFPLARGSNQGFGHGHRGGGGGVF